ncbi:hypothetical protein [Candidatus Burkholderia verschuerenii]|uniref:hypothetical protein n=1 Tax=Candidatus Burkholderia verschuerenii TaxID=242163 RepID=UPI00067BBC62|nr:hypothetical protein [Candidatus Burkholderia verschuerenii]
MAARGNPAKAGKKGAPAGGAQTDEIDNGAALDAAAEAALVIAEAAQPEHAASEGVGEGHEGHIPPTPPVIIGGVPAHALKDIDKATPARTGTRATSEQYVTASATCSQP